MDDINENILDLVAQALKGIQLNDRLVNSGIFPSLCKHISTQSILLTRFVPFIICEIHRSHFGIVFSNKRYFLLIVVMNIQ